jgi:hypothetical protein
MSRLFREYDRCKTEARSRRRNAALEGNEGINAACSAKATAARKESPKKAPRHDATPATNVPIGTPMTVANVTPERIIAVARGESFEATSLPAVANASVQNAPNPAPNNPRPISMIGKFGAVAEMRLDAKSNPDNSKSRWRRSILPAKSTIPGAESAAMIPGIVTIKPAVPGGTSKARDTDGSNPTGKNSVVTKTKVAIVTDATASHARDEDVSVSPVCISTASGLCSVIVNRPKFFIEMNLNMASAVQLKCASKGDKNYSIVIVANVCDMTQRISGLACSSLTVCRIPSDRETSNQPMVK